MNIQLEDLEIYQMKKQKYKDIIQTKVKEAAFQNLLAIKKNHSKMKNVKYRNLELQNYQGLPRLGYQYK